MPITITNRNTTQTGIRKRTLAQVLHVGPLSLKFITLIIFAAVILFYLAQSTQSATNSYNIRALDLQREQLRNEYERLQVETLRLKALSEIKNSTQNLGLEPISGN